MKLDQLIAFVRVVELQSFHKAAEDLNLTTSAISKKITALENRSNFKLMERTTRHCNLTEAGKLFYKQCCELISQYKQTEAVLNAFENELTGMLSIHSTEFIGHKMLTPHLAEFMQQYPNVKVELSCADRIPDFDRENVDIFWGIGVDGPDYAVQKRIGESRHVLAASPAYIEKHGQPQAPKQLTDHRYIGHMLRQQLIEEVTFENVANVNITPFIKVNSSVLLKDLALNHAGIINIMDYEIKQEFADGQLIPLLIDYPQQLFPVNLYYRNTIHTANKIKTFIDFILQRNPDLFV